MNFLLLVALIAGMFMPLQAGLNVKMGKVLGNPIYSALISFAIGTIGLFLYALFTKVDLSRISDTGAASWTLWLAGLLGAFYVATAIIVGPKIGITLTFSLIVAGQMSVSLLLDHYGILGFPKYEINWQRILGIGLVIAGVILIRKF